MKTCHAFSGKCCKGFKVIPDAEHEDRFYVELPDGYRLIYQNDEYIGRYNPNLETVI